jgi:hypothetical protein
MEGRSVDIEALAADDLEYNYDLDGLAALRRRLAAAIHNYQGAHAQYAEVGLLGGGGGAARPRFGAGPPAQELSRASRSVRRAA